MGASHIQYTREVHETFGYTAMWVPTTVASLGDIGVIRGHRFERISNLADHDIAFETLESPATADFEHASANGVDIITKAAGELPPAGASIADVDAGISVRFRLAEAVVFQARNCRVSQVRNLDHLGHVVLERLGQGRWAPDQVVVTEVVAAESATILISSTRGAQIDFAASGRAAVRTTSLADASVGLRAVRSSGLSTSIVAATGLTPLVRTAGVRRRFLSPAEFRARSGGPGLSQEARSGDGPAVFAELGYDDFA